MHLNIAKACVPSHGRQPTLCQSVPFLIMCFCLLSLFSLSTKLSESALTPNNTLYSFSQLPRAKMAFLLSRNQSYYLKLYPSLSRRQTLRPRQI